MQNLIVVFTFFCFILETPLLVNKCKRRAIIAPVTLGSTDVVSCCGECIRGLLLCTALKAFNNLKRTQAFSLR